MPEPAPPLHSTTVPPVLRLQGITKRFPGVTANDHVDLDVYESEVLALLGENGAGKSTLISILYGLYHPDEGEIQLNGKAVRITSPAHALKLGIGLVPQHPVLVNRHSVAENLALGAGAFVRPAQHVMDTVQETSRRYGLEIDPRARVGTLSPGEKQRVEIVRALMRGARILILDEPTSVLTPQEAESLFRVMAELRADGKSLIFISHKLDEVLAISDRVAVLRKGKMVGEAPIGGMTKETLAEMMVGRTVTFDRKRRDPVIGNVLLDVRDVTATSSRGLQALRGVNLQLRAGEVLGVAGVAGNGQSELVEVLAGLRPLDAGEVRLQGKPLTGGPKALFDAGIAHIPEDRIHMGTVPSMTVAENLALREYEKAPLARGMMRDPSAYDANARQLIDTFQISTPGPHTPSRLLSGGNIQKVILARELSEDAKVILAVHPTYGLDIGATEQVHGVLLARTRAGASVLLVSEDLDELMSLSDRIAVMYHGKLLGPFDATSVTREQIGLVMTGGAAPQDAATTGGAA